MKRTKCLMLGSAIFFGFALYAPAFAHEGHKAEHKHPYPSKKFSVRKGMGIYSTYCVSCHGKNGDGKGLAAPAMKPPPTNFLDLQYMTMRSRVDHYEAIANGRAGTAMGAWKSVLSEEQIWDVIAFIEHLFNHRWESDPASFEK